jgi:hypothetical protein
MAGHFRMLRFRIHRLTSYRISEIRLTILSRLFRPSTKEYLNSKQSVPIVAAILHDLFNPSGVIRRIVQLSSAFKIKDYAYRNIRDAQYSEINSQSVLMSSKKKAFQ